jgi:hypothetical protein
MIRHARRVVIKWQMLNAEWGRAFTPETGGAP